jgi:hypothetical protein
MKLMKKSKTFTGTSSFAILEPNVFGAIPLKIVTRSIRQTIIDCLIVNWTNTQCADMIVADTLSKYVNKIMYFLNVCNTTNI